MPRARGGKKRGGKKRGKRGGKSRKGQVMKKSFPHNAYVSQLRTGFPQRMFTTLTYCDNRIFTIDTTSGPLMNYYVYKYRSSLFDPDPINSGHQPLYYNEFSAIYYKYRVYGVKYEIEIQNTNTQQMMPFIIWVGTKSNDIMTPGYDQWQLAEEQQDTRVVRVPNNSGSKTVKGYVSVAKAFGVPKSEVKIDDQFSASINNNPNGQVYIHIYGSSFNISDGNAANVRVKLKYYVEFYNLKTAFASIAPGEVFVPPNPDLIPVVEA